MKKKKRSKDTDELKNRRGPPEYIPWSRDLVFSVQRARGSSSFGYTRLELPPGLIPVVLEMYVFRVVLLGPKKGVGHEPPWRSLPPPSYLFQIHPNVLSLRGPFLLHLIFSKSILTG